MTWLMLAEQPANKKKKADVVTRIRSAETGPYVVISDALVDLFGVGEKEMLQAEVLRRIWEYIKVNNLEVYNLYKLIALIK